MPGSGRPPVPGGGRRARRGPEGALEPARAPAGELRTIAGAIGSPALRAAARYCDGLLAAATADHEAARRYLEEAVDLLEACQTPIECARARLELTAGWPLPAGS